MYPLIHRARGLKFWLDLSARARLFTTGKYHGTGTSTVVYRGENTGLEERHQHS